MVLLNSKNGISVRSLINCGPLCTGKVRDALLCAVLMGKEWVHADRKGTLLCAQTHRTSVILKAITNQFQEE